MHPTVRCAAATAATLLVMCADPPRTSEAIQLPADPARYMAATDNLLLGKAREVVAGEEQEDEELIGKAYEWPHPRPVMRDAIRRKNLAMARRGSEANELVVISLDDLRDRRAADKADCSAAIVAVFAASATSSAAAETDARRCFKLCPELHALTAAATRERLALLEHLLPDAHARRRVLLGAPSLLLHVQLSETLPRKLAALTEATGLTAERACAAAPGLLLFDHEQLEGRLARLRNGLPDELAIALPSMLRRYPRLLARRPETLRNAYDALCKVLPPECDVVQVVVSQPSLLAQTTVRMRTKLDKLRGYCTPTEWRNVCASSSLGRVLTASDEVLERLQRDDDDDDGDDDDDKPRAVVSTLLMTRQQWAQRHRVPAGGERRTLTYVWRSE